MQNYERESASRQAHALARSAGRKYSTAACIWLTSDLLSAPLIFALIIGPDVSLIAKRRQSVVKGVTH